MPDLSVAVSMLGSWRMRVGMRCRVPLPDLLESMSCRVVSFQFTVVERWAYSVQTSFVLPRYTFRDALCQVDAGFLFASGGSEHQRRLEIVVAADGTIFMACVDEKLLTKLSACLLPRTYSSALAAAQGT